MERHGAEGALHFEANGKQIEDFALRILGGVAKKLSGGNLPEELDISLESTNEQDVTSTLHIVASRDYSISAYVYGIDIGKVEPYGEGWSPGVILRRVISYYDEAEHMDETEEVPIPPTIDSDVDGPIASELGYEHQQHGYRFFIPDNRVGNAEASKNWRLELLDDDKQVIGVEEGYDATDIFTFDDDDENSIEAVHNRREAKEVEDLERLYEHGWPVLSTEELEKNLETVTVNDLELILDAFKSFGLVNKNSKALSAKVRGK